MRRQRVDRGKNAELRGVKQAPRKESAYHRHHRSFQDTQPQDPISIDATPVPNLQSFEEPKQPKHNYQLKHLELENFRLANLVNFKKRDSNSQGHQQKKLRGGKLY